MADRIYALDHEPDFLEMITGILSSEGYTVKTCDPLAVEIDDIASWNPDLLIVGIMTGSTAYGWTLIDQIRLNPHLLHTPIIVCTWAPRKLQENISHLDSNVSILPKPFRVESLLSLIQHYLSSQ